MWILMEKAHTEVEPVRDLGNREHGNARFSAFVSQPSALQNHSRDWMGRLSASVLSLAGLAAGFPEKELSPFLIITRYLAPPDRVDV